MHRQTMQLNLSASETIIDARQDSLCDDLEDRVEDGLINQVSDRTIRAQAAERIGMRGRTWMPDLIDAYPRVVPSTVILPRLGWVAPTPRVPNGSVAMRAIMPEGCFIKHAL